MTKTVELKKLDLIEEIKNCQKKQSEAKKDSWLWHELNGAIIAYTYVLTNYYD